MGLRKIDGEKRRFLPLLLSGDEQESLIDGYLESSDLYTWEEAGETVAVCAAVERPQDTVEILNLAVEPDRRRQGLGRTLLLAVCRRYPGRAAVLGTGETPGTLAFYRSCGFTEYGREPNYFPKHYDHAIVEEGVVLRDRILLRREAEETDGR